MNRPTNSRIATCALLASIVALVAGSGLEVRAADAPMGIVDHPCPEPLVPPAGVVAGEELLLKPGALDPKSFPPPDGPAEEAYWKELGQRAESDWPNLCRYAIDDAADLARGPVRVVYLGDSITEFWVHASPEVFTHGIVGRGISGQTTAQMVLRFQTDVVALHPKVVHLLAGTNDTAGNTGPLRAIDVENNLRTMAEIARAHGIRVVLGTIPPADHFFWRKGLDPRAPIAELNRWIRSYAASNALGLVDYHAVLADADGAFKATLSNDGVHPNRDGYRAMERAAAPVIRTALAR